MWDDAPFSGPSRSRGIDLSTSNSSSSSALLSNVRAERLAREQRRREERAAVRIQSFWRGRHACGLSKTSNLQRVESGQLGIDIEGRGRALVGLLRGGLGNDEEFAIRMEDVVVRWCQDATRVEDGGIGLLSPLDHDQSWATILAILCSRMLELINLRPTSSNAGILLDTLESVFESKNWTFLRSADISRSKEAVISSVSVKGWVQQLVQVLEKLIASSTPKRKHAHLQPVTRLLTAPLILSPPTPTSSLIPPLINHLLAVPSLPTSIPIPSLTHLSTSLPLFTLLLPYAASNPQLLHQGRLSGELQKTYFLANLATFGITGGMLSRYGASAAQIWVKVVGEVLRGVNEGWGRWVEGIVEEVDDDDMKIIEDDSDDDPAPALNSTATLQAKVLSVPASAKRSRQVRQPLPKSIGNKAALLASQTHLSTLANLLVGPSSKASSSALVEFATFILSLMGAFRGSPKWEGIMDALMEGQGARSLGKRLWREGVRGRWTRSAESTAWGSMASNPSTPCLMLLTYLFNHYLLLTPDDEFFSDSTSNPLTLDEVLDLSSIWRDLAYWGYMNGVNSNGSGTEEARSLFTRGVTRVAERNARRKFASDDHWVMPNLTDLRGFVESAVFEDAELAQPDGSDNTNNATGELPRWALARQRFTKRQMAYISPRLGLLNNLPMAVPFQTRLEVFRQFVEADRNRLGLDRHYYRNRVSATIHRTNLAEDGFRQLNSLGPALKGRIQIVFIDKWDQEESGIDGGGLFKEFLTSLSKEAFDTNRGLWLATDQNELYPNPHSYATESHQLSWYGFIGRVLGKALYEGILVDVSFADFFLAKWLGRQSYLDDLASLDKDLYKGLITLKNYPRPEELALNFTVTEQEFGVVKSVDLVPNGSEVAVTAENRHEYIQLVCKYKLDKQIAAQSRAFFNGLSDIIDEKWLRMFDQRELRQLVGGEETLIDLDDLREHANVSGFPNDVTPRLFWKVVKSFNQEERKALLRFVTSCSRPPLLGFAHLNPGFGIRCSGTDTSRLPSASSCFNLLKLPGYLDEVSMRTKLLQAITSEAGFDLS